MNKFLGKGDYSYEPVPDWAHLPPELALGDVAGIAVDKKDRVYLFNRGSDPVVVLSQNGDVLSTWGHDVFSNPHGASIGPDQCIYLTDNFDHTVRKFSLDGKLLLEIGTAGVSSGFLSGKPFCKCTHSAVSPSGDIFVSDGYQNACMIVANQLGSAVTGAAEDQRRWIEAYKAREMEGVELYYIIEHKLTGLPCGLVRLYDIKGDQFTWGSWVLDDNKPSKAALESAILAFGVGFNMLDKQNGLIDVRIENKRATEIYRRFGMTQVRDDEQNVYFHYPRERFEVDYEAHMSVLQPKAER